MLDDLERIFERYFTDRPTVQLVANGEELSAHYGIGLWIVRRNLEALGGSAEARNLPDYGFEMTLRIPLAAKNICLNYLSWSRVLSGAILIRQEIGIEQREPNMADVATKPERKSARAKGATPRVPQKFVYMKPADQKDGKAIVSLCQTDIIRGAVQVVKEGGDNNLHSHTGMDGFWMVLKGAVRFYGPGDEVLGEFGAHEGIVMPRGAEYWFESCGDVDLELLQVVAFDRDVKNERVDVNERKFDVDATERFDGRIRD
jgi:mannose-6-phosphate isomerase-like protein (cupin superfamily)